MDPTVYPQICLRKFSCRVCHMRDGAPGDVRTLHHLEALAALGHPDRARLMDALTVSGTSTTSALAAAVDLATGSVSHHLQVLSRAGLVERAEPGQDRRQRRWKLVTRGYNWTPAEFRDQPAGRATVTAAMAVQVDREHDRAQEFIATGVPPWDEAAFSGHYWLRLTPAELVEVGHEIDELLLRWRRREIPDDDDPNRQTVLAFARAFPSQP
jgi:DNA-binding transcriptional ArsR family regulator